MFLVANVKLHGKSHVLRATSRFMELDYGPESCGAKEQKSKKTNVVLHDILLHIEKAFLTHLNFIKKKKSFRNSKVF